MKYHEFILFGGYLRGIIVVLIENKFSERFRQQAITYDPWVVWALMLFAEHNNYMHLEILLMDSTIRGSLSIWII